MAASPPHPSIIPLSPDTQASTISLDDFSDSQYDLDQLEHAVEELPDSDPGDHLLSPSPADDASLAIADEDIIANGDAAGNALAPARAGAVRTARPRTAVDRQIAALEPQTRPWELQNLLSLSGQTLGVASSASSVGFSFAREATSLSLNIAKRLTQVAVALPAMAIDAAAGTAPGSGNPTAATIAHKSVGGLFDLLTTLAVGGIDLGSALTSAGLGAASTGIEGVRRSLGSEVVKALGQFVKLVQREWNAQDDCLPPGGIPGFGATGVTRALIVWICIQMVTREDYEKRLLKELQEIDVDALRIEVEEEQRAAAGRDPQGGGLDASSTSGAAVGTVRITSEASDQAGGEVIGAEIGSSQAGPGVDASATSSEPLSNKEAMQGLLRYSSMVLAVYGGTALAWFGKLPQTEAEAARAASPRRPTPASGTNAPDPGLSSSSALPADGMTRAQDEEQFLEAAAMMDLPEEDRESLHLRFEKERDRRAMPGGFGARSESVDEAGSVVFNADDPEAGSKATGAAPGTPSGRASGAGSIADRQHANGSSTAGEAPTKSYSYLNIIAGEHDEELFHRVSKLERQHVQTGSYHDERPGAEELQEETISPPSNGPRIPRPSKPRYYVVTDHKSRKIILVLRGSLSLGDIAADLTCESREFYFPDPAARGEVDPAESAAPEGQQTNSVPFPGQDASTSARAAKFIDPDQSELPLVHEGMYETSLGVGAINRPVHRAVRSALLANPGYNLDIAGHSLGAGVASLLAIMWANPETTLTTTASGLPPGRKLHSYCYGCPATMSASLGRRCHKLITSYVYSYDFICRLSLGSIQDIRNAVAWILWEDQQESLRQRQQRSQGSSSADGGEAPFNPSDRSTPLRVPALLTRAFEHQAGRLDSSPETKAAVETDFLALRRTLEANMRNVELFVPGQLLYLFKGQDFLVEEEQKVEQGQEGAAGSGNAASAAPAAEGEAGASALVAAPPSPKKVKGTKQRGFILRPAPSEGAGAGRGGRVENVFDQVIFSRDLISCHMPSVYDAALKGMIGRR